MTEHQSDYSYKDDPEYLANGNQRFSIVPSASVSDLDLSDSAYRTLGALGIFGDKNGWCWPGLARLAKMRGMTRQAVSKHIQELKNKGYIVTHARYDKATKSRKSNLVQIKFDRPYATPEVDTLSTPEVDTLSTPEVDVNAPMNALFDRKENLKKDIVTKGGLDWQVLANITSEEVVSQNKIFAARKEMCDEYERAMGYNPLNWSSKELEILSKFLEKQTPESIHAFAEWSKNPYNGLSPAKARQFPKLVIDLWLQAMPKENINSKAHLL